MVFQCFLIKRAVVKECGIMYCGDIHLIRKIKTKCIQKTLTEAGKDVLVAIPFLFCSNSRNLGIF